MIEALAGGVDFFIAVHDGTESVLEDQDTWAIWRQHFGFEGSN